MKLKATSILEWLLPWRAKRIIAALRVECADLKALDAKAAQSSQATDTTAVILLAAEKAAHQKTAATAEAHRKTAERHAVKVKGLLRWIIVSHRLHQNIDPQTIKGKLSAP